MSSDSHLLVKSSNKGSMHGKGMVCTWEWHASNNHAIECKSPTDTKALGREEIHIYLHDAVTERAGLKILK